MKKIIVAIDGLKFLPSATSYVIHLAKHTEANIVGVFLDDMFYHSYKIFEMVTTMSNVGLLTRIDELDEKDASQREKAADLFKKTCEDAGVHCTIHHDKNFALSELLHESVYADLLIINRSETFSQATEASPTTFIKDMLADIQCPVLLVPDAFKEIERVTILYDGKPASVYAIKMFSCMFPSLRKLNTEVLFVGLEKDDANIIPDGGLLKEFIASHIPNASYVILQGDPQEAVVNYCKVQSSNQLLVLGAYNRSRVSRWFKHSMADELMQQTDLPLFIAHSV